MIKLENICKTYNIGSVNETVLFKNLNLSIKKGEFVSVVGSNGSGKTSLLNIICGSIPVDSGRFLLNQKNIINENEHVRSKFIGRVFQNPQKGTCKNMTILENLSMADNKGRPFNLTKGITKRKIEGYKEKLSRLGLGLEDKLNVPAGSLSGGQRQALALLMATMTPIDLLILDEHTAALDPKTSETIMQLTNEVVEEKKLTTLMVTHNLKFASLYGNRLLMMHQGEIIIDDRDKTIDIPILLDTFNNISIETGN